MKFAVSLLFIVCFSVSYDTASASGVCSVSGGGHYYTFDGNEFDYQGTCSRALLANNCNGMSDVFVYLYYENRDGVANVSYVRSVLVEIGLGTDTTAVYIAHPTSTDPVDVRVNEDAVSLPYTGTFYTITSVSETCYDDIIILDFLTAGIQVRYSEWAVTLILADKFKYMMCGMCGDFNDDPTDDLTDGSFDVSSVSNRGRAWGSHWLDTPCSTLPPDDVPNCTDNSYACNTACDYLANSNGIYSAAVRAIGSSLAQYYKEDCKIDACMSSGKSIRKSVRQFLTVARLKNSGCTGCNVSIAGFPHNYAGVSCNDNRCDCSSSLKSCQLHVPLCGYWCDCIGRSSGYGTLYKCWDDTVPNRCYPVNEVDADTCTAKSGTAGNNPYPFILL